jgi:hypothetical protein
MAETLDLARAQAFGERMVGALNDAALMLLTSLGGMVVSGVVD